MLIILMCAECALAPFPRNQPQSASLRLIGHGFAVPNEPHMTCPALTFKGAFTMACQKNCQFTENHRKSFGKQRFQRVKKLTDHMVSRQPLKTLGRHRFRALVKGVIGPVLLGRTVQAAFKPFKNHWENNVSVPLPPTPIMPPAGAWPRITWFSRNLGNP